MSDEFSIRLCKLVQGHPELYDIFNDNFHNEDAKNSAWNLISTELGVPQSKCVIKWKALKHQFVKAKKEQNTTWDLWPTLQFLDEAADKAGSKKRKRESMAASTGPENADLIDSGSRKRKRESTAAPTRSPSDGTDLMDSTPSKIPENPPAKKVATRGKQAASTPSRTPEYPPAKKVATRGKQAASTSPAKGDANIVAPGTSEPSSTSSSKPSQTKAAPRKSIVKSQPEPVQPTAGNNSARRRSQRFGRDESAAEMPAASKTVAVSQAKFGRDGSAAETPAASKTVAVSQANSQETTKKPTTEPPALAPAVSPPVPKPKATGASATPRGRRSTRFTVAETIPEEKEGPTAVAPSKSPGKQPKAKQPSGQETPKKVSVEPVAVAPANSPVAKPQPATKATPRGRRSTRVTLAEIIPEEAQEETTAAAAPPNRSPGKEPKAKQPRIEGNGIADEVDPLADMKFDSALDQKFFKQLQEKFAKLRPEVVATMKASIFAMLDNAARA